MFDWLFQDVTVPLGAILILFVLMPMLAGFWIGGLRVRSSLEEIHVRGSHADGYGRSYHRYGNDVWWRDYGAVGISDEKVERG